MTWSRTSRRGVRAGGAMVLVALGMGAAIGPVRAQGDCITLEDFANASVGQFPSGWRARKEEGKAVYSVRDEEGIRFLHAAANGLGIQAAKEIAWDLNAYPILVWSWRPVEFPKGGDERQSSTNDSPLAVYILVDYSRSGAQGREVHLERAGPRRHPPDLEHGPHPGPGPPKRGARDRQWVEERVNVREDFKKYFSESETPKPAGIAVLTIRTK